MTDYLTRNMRPDQRLGSLVGTIEEALWGKEYRARYGAGGYKPESLVLHFNFGGGDTTVSFEQPDAINSVLEAYGVDTPTKLIGLQVEALYETSGRCVGLRK